MSVSRKCAEKPKGSAAYLSRPQPKLTAGANPRPATNTDFTCRAVPWCHPERYTNPRRRLRYLRDLRVGAAYKSRLWQGRFENARCALVSSRNRRQKPLSCESGFINFKYFIPRKQLFTFTCVPFLPF